MDFGDLLNLDFSGGGGGGGGDFLSMLLGLGGQAASGIGQAGSALGGFGGDAFGALSQNPLAALSALSQLGGVYQTMQGPQNQQGPAQFPQMGPPLAGPYPRRGVPRADFQAQGLSGASPDFWDQMTNPQYQDPYAYTFQPPAEERRQTYA